MTRKVFFSALVLACSAACASTPKDGAEPSAMDTGVRTVRNAVGGLVEGLGRTTTGLADATEDAINNPKTARETASDVGGEGFNDAVTAPLMDLNLRTKETPERLTEIDYVYEHGISTDGDVAVPDCDALAAEIAELDQVLGYDYDIIRQTEDGEMFGAGAGNVFLAGVEGATTFFIPFRGAVREVSGAASEERARTQAFVNGFSRRAHLKGIGLGLGCEFGATPLSTEAPIILRVDRNGVPYRNQAESN
ncbi:MAG: hypothetical protein AAFX02_05260 [Pseudomonadota bacterium]